MELGVRGTALILDFEKFRSKPYRDQKGIPTIGYGTIYIDGKPVTMDTPPCTQAQAMEWFRKDANEKVGYVNRLLRKSLTQNQFDAIVSFAYNVGQGGFGSSSLLRAINSGAPVTEDLFLKWNKVRMPSGELVVSNGLTRRRQAEYALYTTP